MEDEYKVKNPEVQKRLLELGEHVKANTPEGMIFTLLLSDLGQTGATFYLSSGVREDCIHSMLEFVAAQGGRADTWLIWSNEHKAWWKANGSGYVENRAAAGRYSYGEAAQICRDANAHPRRLQEPNEAMVQDC